MKLDCFYNGIRTGAALLDRVGSPDTEHRVPLA
jgi:hypothetical protein